MRARPKWDWSSPQSTQADVVQLVPKVAHLAVERFGRIDGLVVNHGILGPLKRIEQASIEDWKSVFEVNLFSAFELVKTALPHLRESKGHVVFTSSGAAIGAYASWGAYGSSKAAMNSLAQHIAVEEADITAVAIGPGRVDTDMQRELRENGAPGSAMSENDHAGFVSAFNEGRLNKPEWPGHVIAKLALHTKKDVDGRYLRHDGLSLPLFKTNH